MVQTPTHGGKSVPDESGGGKGFALGFFFNLVLWKGDVVFQRILINFVTSAAVFQFKVCKHDIGD